MPALFIFEKGGIFPLFITFPDAMHGVRTPIFYTGGCLRRDLSRKEFFPLHIIPGRQAWRPYSVFYAGG